MDIDSVSTQVVEFIRSEIQQSLPEAIAADTPLLELGILDSLSMVNLISFLESRFGVKVPEHELIPDNFATPSAIARMVCGGDRAAGAEPVDAASATPAAEVLEAAPELERVRKVLSGGRSVSGLRMDGPAPTWILLPPLGGGASFWTPVLSALQGRRSAIALDLAGFGGSDTGRTDPGFEDQVALISSYLDTVHGPLVLAGCSAGAMIGAALARREEHRVQALLVSGFGAFEDVDAWRVRIQRLSASPAAFVKSMFHEVPAHAALLEQGLATTLANPAYGSFFDEAALVALRAGFEGLHTPTLFVMGRQDALVGVAEVEAALKKLGSAKLSWLDRCGHLAPSESPREFVRAAEAFVDALDLD